jgi:hypothetical protein
MINVNQKPSPRGRVRRERHHSLKHRKDFSVTVSLWLVLGFLFLLFETGSLYVTQPHKCWGFQECTSHPCTMVGVKASGSNFPTFSLSCCLHHSTGVVLRAVPMNCGLQVSASCLNISEHVPQKPTQGREQICGTLIAAGVLSWEGSRSQVLLDVCHGWGSGCWGFLCIHFQSL